MRADEPRPVTPPHAPEAEANLCGALLSGDEDAAAKVFSVVRPSMIYSEMNRRVAGAAFDLWSQGAPVNVASIADELRRKRELDGVGGMSALAELLEAFVSIGTIDHSASVVADRYARRRLLEQLQHAAAIAIEDGYDIGRSVVLRSLDGIEQEVAPSLRRTRLLSVAAIETLPRPDFLIDGLLVASGLSVLFGPPGAGKSFLALDWSLCIGTGFRWMARPVIRGPVVYVAAEGSAGLGARVRAWKEHRGYAGNPDVHFLAAPAQLLEPSETEALLGDLRRLSSPPAALVLDTVARCMAGGDENSTEDMGRFVASVDRIRRETGAAAILLHHTNKAGELERGSTALRGAADGMLALKAEDGTLTLTCEKAKDAEPFTPIRLSLQPVAESCVISGPMGALDQDPENLSPNEVKGLTALQRGFLDDGASATDWLAASKLAKSSFFHVRTSLVRKDFVAQRGRRYVLTAKAEAFLDGFDEVQRSNGGPTEVQNDESGGPTNFRAPYIEGRNWTAGRLDLESAVQTQEAG
jgi:hypothetical protein